MGLDRLLGENDPEGIYSVLEVAREECVEYAGGDAAESVCIADELLPGFFWLIGRYPGERVEAFGRAKSA